MMVWYVGKGADLVGGVVRWDYKFPKVVAESCR